MVETVLGMTDLQIKLVTAAGQLALALMVAFIAWQQWQTARNKLKADLFDRRVKLYDKFMDLSLQVFTGDPDYANIELRTLLGDIRWVFGQDLSERLRNEVLPSFSAVGVARAELAGVPVGDERTRLVNNCYRLQNVASENIRRVPDLFAPYLTLTH